MYRLKDFKPFYWHIIYLNIYSSGCCGSTTIFPFSSIQRILPPSFNPYEDTIKAGIVVRKDPPLLVARFNIDS